MPSKPPSSQSESAPPDWLEIVRSKVEELSYGVIQIIVHDHKVTQIEKTEKTRLDSPKSESLRRRDGS